MSLKTIFNDAKLLTSLQHKLGMSIKRDLKAADNFAESKDYAAAQKINASALESIDALLFTANRLTKPVLKKLKYVAICQAIDIQFQTIDLFINKKQIKIITKRFMELQYSVPYTELLTQISAIKV
jgi:hypothetical protein